MTPPCSFCPGPAQDNIVLASSRLPTWPCLDEQLMALEAMGRVCSLHLCHAGLRTISFTPPPPPPICDGAGSASSADHSIPGKSALTSAAQAWLKWAADSDLAKRVFSHISLSRPEHPLSDAEQSQALAVLSESLGQPRTALSLGTYEGPRELPLSWMRGRTASPRPPAKPQPLSQSGLEVCQGNWKPAEERS